jgi:hypothetical protein
VRTLSVVFLIALGATMLFSFTLIGLAGEAVAMLALVGLLLRGACSLTATIRRVPRC